MYPKNGENCDFFSFLVGIENDFATDVFHLL
jgi:hypothetical protein